MMPPQNSTKTLEQELDDLSIGSNDSSSSQSEGGLSFDEDATYIHSPSSKIEDGLHVRSDDSSSENVKIVDESNIIGTHDGFVLDAVTTSVDKEEDSCHVDRQHSSLSDEDHSDLKNESEQFEVYTEELEDEKIEVKPRVDLINALAIVFSKSDPTELMKWHNRTQNRLVYRKSYRPVPRENREVEQLLADIVKNKKAASEDSSFCKYLYPSNDEPKPIILKREHVTCCFNDHIDRNMEIKEFVLLNHCLLILPAKLDFDVENTNDDHIEILLTQNSSGRKKDRILKSTKMRKATNGYDSCLPLTSIVSIEDYDMEFGDSLPLPSLGLKVLTEERKVLHYKIHCFSEDLKDKWITSLRTSVTCNLGVDEDSIYSSVLCNDLDAIVKKMILVQNQLEDENMLDKIHGYSALHLAVITSKNMIAKHLLSAGVNPHTVAKDGSSPLTCAEFFQNHEMVDVFKNIGTENHIQSPKSVQEDSKKRAEFFTTISNITTNISENEESDVVSASEAAKLYGRPNKHLPVLMAGLQERGEKLNDIEIKSSNLKNAALNYGNMAKLLREQMEQKKTKKKKRFLFF